MRAIFEKEGRIWFRQALTETDLQNMDDDRLFKDKAGARVESGNIQKPLSKIARILSPLTSQANQLHAVRTVAFNKTDAVNWGVPWHQDRVIALRNRHEVKGYFNWSQKSGIWHCEPPLPLLNSMYFVRVHLDDCDAQNGAMQIAVGSHIEGWVATRDANRIAEKYPQETCTAKRGDILVLKMLTLHRSSPARNPLPRRTFRIDFASDGLPAPLEWA